MRHASMKATDARPSGSLLRWAGLLSLLMIGWLTTSPAVAVTTTCGAATTQGTAPADFATYCWFNLSGYVDATARGAAGQNFVVNFSGGATLSFNLKASTPAGSTSSLFASGAPSWTGAALGNTAFNGIPGQPVLYETNNATTVTLNLTGIVLAVNGSTNVPYALVAADGESTNTGEALSFTTNGNPWSLLSSIPNGGVYPGLGGVGTATVTETGVAGTVGSYAFATTGSPTAVSAVMTGGGLQGVAFGVKFSAADLAITKSHTGDFSAGGTGSYNIAVHNNGPDTAGGITTVTDTLPVGLSYASASGTGWTCAAVGQVVTCTNPTSIANGSNLPAITLNVNVAAAAPNTVNNVATVSNPTFDYVAGNSSSTDPTTIVHSDLSSSTKTVLDTNGGDANPGDTLRYTITLTSTNAVAATNVSVSDDMPAGVSGLNVISAPAGSTNASTTSGGANGTGKVSVSGISVPANGSVTIVYEVTVAGSDPSGFTIDNTATITNPNGTGGSPAAPTVTVSQSQVAASGDKVLYVYANLTMSRTPQTVAATDSIGENSSDPFTLSALQKPLVLTPGGTVSVSIITSRTGSTISTSRRVHAELYKNGSTLIGTSTSQTFTSGTATLRTFNITVPNNGSGSLATGDTLVLRVVNESSGNGTQSIALDQFSGGNRSTVTFNTTTVINVDSVNVYSAAYSATTTKTAYAPGDQVFVRAVISDPFGSYDVNHATVTLTDPSGLAQVTSAAMTQVADSGAATRTYEYSYTLPANATIGFWTASVTGYEGTEGTVTHTANGAFNVGVPNLTVMKAVTAISDPVEGTTKPKAMPGATMQYQITVTNNGNGPPDNNSLIITDPIPANTKFVLGSVVFADGSPSSGLTLLPANVTYSNNGGTSFVYVPVNDGSGADPLVTNLRIAPQGIMAAKTGATAPSFSVLFKVIIK